MKSKYGIWIGILGFVSSAFGQLEWTQKVIDIKASPSDANAKAQFEFKNTGDKPITISSVQSSCGCTTVQLEKKNYEPGEKGEIVANFEFKERVGQQEKTILVSSDDPKDPNVALTLKVLIPQLVKVEPTTLVWENGEEKISKSANFQLLEEGKMKVQGVHSPNTKMAVQLKEIAKGKEYEVVVTPEDTEEVSVSVIEVEGEIEGGKVKKFPVYAQIRGKTSSQSYGTALSRNDVSPPAHNAGVIEK